MQQPREKYGPWRTVHRGPTYLIKQSRVLLPSGKVHLRELAIHKPGVVILAIDAKNNLLLNHEYRSRQKNYVWRLPAGGIEPRELPRHAAQRELREEAGVSAGRLKLFYKNDGRGSQSMHWPWFAFYATRLKRNPLPAEESEDIRARRVPLIKAAQMALKGKIGNEWHALLILKLQEALKRRAI